MQQKEEKKKIIEELAGVFKNPVSILVIEYRGLDVKSMQSVRKQVNETDAELRVVKNKLLHKACEGTDVEQIRDLFQGPTAIAICGQESPATAKVFVQARKKFESLVLKGGLVDGKVCGVAEIEQISKLPSRQILISMFASTLVSPISNFVGVVDRMRHKLLHALEALKETKDGQDAPGEEQAESSAGEVGAQGARTDEPKAEAPAGGESSAAEETEKTTEEGSSKNQNKKEENNNG